MSTLPTPTLLQAVRGFRALSLCTAQAKLTYRLSTLVSLVASGFAYCVFLLVWREVYRQNPHPGPIEEAPMMAYLVSAFLLNAVLTLFIELRFLQRVRLGLVTSDLVRPLGFMSMQMAQAVGDALVNLAFVVPIFVVGYVLLGSALLPASPLSMLLGLVSAGLAFLVTFGISYLIVQASFVLQSGYGVLFARAALHQVFSGLAAPLVMFPAGLRAAARYLPFRHVIETPVVLWLGMAPSAAAPVLLAEQAAWGAGLLAFSSLIFGAVMRRHQVQGG